ncbi:MAG TPA: GAF domain-containing protein [Dehalococcoidia bacterium]|nr:GAF domain-containing protein [Dehalococcoidia bacterium]
MTTRFSIPLRDIDDCFQGAVPAMLATSSATGVPNVTDISIVTRVDDELIALSRQFFNKTIANLQSNPRGNVVLIDGQTGRQYKLDFEYDHTETEGPLFDRMSARLEAVASQAGMSKVFKLAAADVCRVIECAPVPVDHEIPPPDRAQLDVAKVDVISRRITRGATVDGLLTETLAVLDEEFGYTHAFIMLVDETGRRLYTVASRGYPESGVGSEVRFGDGILGVAAERRETVSLANVQADMSYSRTVRSGFERTGATDIEQEIDLPGLPNVASQHVVPIEVRDQLIGLLCFESEQRGRFDYMDDFVFHLAAREMGMQLTLLRADFAREPALTAQLSPDIKATGATSQLRHYTADDSVFLDNEYLIKGVAGRVLWRLLQSYVAEQRVDFTNKEIRLDPTLELPDIKDNLEARLALLRRRLEDRCDFMRIVNTGRGRIRLEVKRELALREVGDAPPV